MDSTTTQIVIAYLMSHVIEWLKKASWFPVVSENSTKFGKWMFSGIMAACSAMAITIAWEPTGGVLTLTGLTLSNVTNGLIAFALSFITQQVVYEKMIKKV